MVIEEEAVRRVIAALILLAALSAVAATIYLWRVYHGVSPGFRSRLYGAIAVSATLVTTGALLVLWPASLAVLDQPRLAAELNLALVGFGIVLALTMPTFMANFIRKLRARRKAKAAALWKGRE